MTEKKKIIAIYTTVAIICAILITGFQWIGNKRREMAAENAKRHRQDNIVITEVIAPPTTLDKQITENLSGLNQDGAEVSLNDLKGKVVVFAQFYSRCHMCLSHNRKIMMELHEELKANPKVHFVTVTVDPEFDTPEKLKAMAESWQADSTSWWMLNVPNKAVLAKFCREQLWYVDFADNEDAKGDADAINHDMGIAVIDGTGMLRAKLDLYTPLAQEKLEEYQIKKAQLMDVIQNSLPK